MMDNEENIYIPVSPDEEELLEIQDLTTDYGTTLYFKHSFLINPTPDNHEKQADFRTDNYQINHIVEHNHITYYNFFHLITPNIVVYILRTLPKDKNPIKYTFVIHNENEKTHFSFVKNIKAFSPDLVIYLPNTLEINDDRLYCEIDRAILAQNLTEYGWIFKENKMNTLTIIQERITIPRCYIKSAKPQTKLSKTFKEDTCVVCMVNSTNILYCNCGRLVVCEKCFNKLDNKNKCLKCREENTIIRKI